MFGFFKRSKPTNYSSQNVAVNRENVKDEHGNIFQRLSVDVVANPAVCAELERILTAQVYQHLAQSQVAGKPTTLEEIAQGEFVYSGEGSTGDPLRGEMPYSVVRRNRRVSQGSPIEAVLGQAAV